MALKSFTKPKNKLEDVDEDKINDFIDYFNRIIDAGKLSVNDADDSFGEIPYLNDAEFQLAVGQAKLIGYVLDRKPDNYNTTSYYLKPI